MKHVLHAYRSMGALAIALLLSTARIEAQQTAGSAAVQGRVLARRPLPAATRPLPADSVGLRTLDVDAAGTAMLYIPAGYRADRPRPIVVMLHGAAGNPR